MRRLRYSKAANQDLNDIARFVRRDSGNPTTALEFINRLRSQCARLADLPGTLGRSRADIRPGSRSFAVGSYIIIFRYETKGVDILRIIERHRDVGAQFERDEE